MISTFRWVMSKSGFEQKHPKNRQLSMCVLYMCVACIRTCMKQDTTFIKMFFCFEHKSNFCFSLNPRYDSFGQNTFTKWIIVFVKRNIFRDGKKNWKHCTNCVFTSTGLYLEFTIPNRKTLLQIPYYMVHMCGQRTE